MVGILESVFVLFVKVIISSSESHHNSIQNRLRNYFVNFMTVNLTMTIIAVVF